MPITAMELVNTASAFTTAAAAAVTTAHKVTIFIYLVNVCRFVRARVVLQVKLKWAQVIYLLLLLLL